MPEIRVELHQRFLARFLLLIYRGHYIAIAILYRPQRGDHNDTTHRHVTRATCCSSSSVPRAPAELPWIKFKTKSAATGAEIARYVSALSNSATLNDENSAYLIWGISDDHHVVGTTFSWQTTKGKGNEDLLPWLTRAIIPTPQLKFLDV